MIHTDKFINEIENVFAKHRIKNVQQDRTYSRMAVQERQTKYDKSQLIMIILGSGCDKYSGDRLRLSHCSGDQTLYIWMDCTPYSA
jgi:hypothetical protein